MNYIAFSEIRRALQVLAAALLLLALCAGSFWLGVFFLEWVLTGHFGLGGHSYLIP